MISGRSNNWYRLAALVLVLVLLVPLLAACGDDNKETTTVTATRTVTATPGATTPAPTTPPATPTKKEPVKLGLIQAWSGGAAVVGTGYVDPIVALVEDELKEMGGILGGRPVEFIRHDDQSSPAGDVAGVAKFAGDKSVSAVLLGGASGAAIGATAGEAAKQRIPFFTLYNEFAKDIDISYATGIYGSQANTWRKMMDMVYALNAKTMAVFGMRDLETEVTWPGFKKEVESKGIKIVYDDVFNPGTIDFSPYLTRIKFANPDVLIFIPIVAPYPQNVFKQIVDLGGWGKIRVITPSKQTMTAANLPGAEGVIAWTTWIPGSTYPGAQSFEKAYVKKYGKLPIEGQPDQYWAIWTAIKAIEMAGSSDREAINKAAHSGNLKWETPGGPVTVGTDGKGYLPGLFVQIQGGKPVEVK